MAEEQKKAETPVSGLSATGVALEPLTAGGRPLTLRDIFDEDPKEYIRVPGFVSGTVAVLQSLTAGDLIEWSEASEGTEQKRRAGLRLITKALVDGEPGVDVGAKGIPLMSELHIDMLKDKMHKKTERLVKAILKQNEMRVKGDTDSKND